MIFQKIWKNNGIFAALDVFLNEPEVNINLINSQNVYCTPHIGGNAEEAIKAMGLSSVMHIKDYFSNEEIW